MVRFIDPAASVSRAAGVVLTAVLIVSAATPSAQPELVIHKEGTKQYHRPGCPVIRDGVGVLALSRGQAEARGYTAHPECDPAKQPRGNAGGGRSRGDVSPATPVVTVYIDGPKHYHRKECPKLITTPPGPKAIALQAAAKSHWPCPACKAPILKRNTEPAVPGTGRRRGG